MDLENLCATSGGLTVFLIIKYTINIVCILVPIILMYKSISALVPVVISGQKLNEKISSIIKSTIAAIIIFLIPSLFNFVFTDIVDMSSSDIVKCFDSATVENIKKYREKEAEDVKKKLEEQKKEAEEAAKKKAEEEAKQKENLQPNSQNEEYQGLPGYGTIFVGDSRTVHFSYQLKLRDTDQIFATSAGAMKEFQVDISKALNHINANSSHRYNLVLNYGVNNLGQDWVGAYTNIINKVDNKANIVILSVNPCREGACNNNRIRELNNKLQAAFSSGYKNVRYCDSFTPFMSQASSDMFTNDGVHYTNKAANFIYSKILECLNDF